MASLSVKEIYKGSTISGGLTLTDTFNDSNLAFIIPQNLPVDEGYEIAAALMIKLQITETIAGLPITTNYGEREIPLDITFLDTGNILYIPEEVVKQGLECYIVFATSYPINIAVYAVKTTEPSNQDLLDKVDELKQIVDQIKVNQETKESLNNAVNTVVNVLLPLLGIPTLPSLPPFVPINLLPGL